MGLRDQIMGKGGEFKAMPTQNPQQQQIFSQMLSGLEGAGPQITDYLKNLMSGSPEAMQAFQAPAMRQFNQQTVPGLAERFSGMGEGAQSSSAFPQALGQAGAGLAENLQAQRSQLQQGASSQLMQMLGMGTTTPTFNWQQMPGIEGLLPMLVKGLSSGIGQMGGMMGSGFLGKSMGLFGK